MMEQTLRSIYQERASESTTLSILIVQKTKEDDPLTDMFDAVLLVISSDETKQIYTKHYKTTEGIAIMHVISDQQLKKWLIVGTNKKVVDWLFNGAVYFDRNGYLEQLKMKLKEVPYFGHDIKMGIELSRLVQSYVEGKKLYTQGDYLDAYNQIINSLHHLAKLAIIEKGFFPEVKAWKQVKIIEPAIYKLYEELVNGDEPLEKRLELLFLASDFFIHNRIEKGAEHILRVLGTKKEWEIQELYDHRELSLYSTNLGVLLEYLVQKGYIEVIEKQSKNKYVCHRLYRAISRS